MNHYKNKNFTICRRSNQKSKFRGKFTESSIHNYKTWQKNFGMEISPEETETMVILEQGPLRCEIVVDNKSLQQLTNFKCLGYEISYENEKDIQQKLAKFSQLLGILNNTFKSTLVHQYS